jgi:CDP-glucose 4,6-dehydratase
LRRLRKTSTSLKYEKRISMKAAIADYWFGKNVLITGVNGFIGGALAQALAVRGANVFGLIRNGKQNTFLFYEKINEKITLVNGDLTDRFLFSRVVSEEQIQCVFHLAAQVEVGVALENPFLTFETNVRGTYLLLDAIRQFPERIESVVVASTDKAYGSYPKHKMPYKEDYPLHPKYPYDVSKACADLIAQSYASEIYRLPIVVTRFCNIYGPGQLNFSAVFPDSIRACLGYGTFVPRGNGNQIRDFIYVADVVDLYLRIGEDLAKRSGDLVGNIYNAGTNTPTSIRDALRLVYSLTGRVSEFQKILEIMKSKETVGEIDCQYMDHEKVREHFGWEPKHTLEDGIMKTIRWYDKYLRFRYG